MTPFEKLSGMVKNIEDCTIQKYKMTCHRDKLLVVLDYLDEQGFQVKAELSFGDLCLITAERIIANR